MDIRDVTPEEKRIYIDRVRASFDDLRMTLATLECDMESDDLKTQASSVWIAGNLASWYSDFVTQIRQIDEKQQALTDIKNEIKEASNASE